MQKPIRTIRDAAVPGRIEILLVGENGADAQLCERALHQAGMDVSLESARTAEEFRALFSAKAFHLVLAEQTLEGWSGIEALELLQQLEKDIPFILLATTLPDEPLIQLLRNGGSDFVEKDRLFLLPLTVERALEKSALRQEQINLTAQLHHSRKLESVGRLAVGVAHDFNNILTVIKCHVGLLRAQPSLGAEMSESLQQMSRASERACRLTRQLLDFSRKQAVPAQPLDLNEVVTNLSMLLHRTLGEDVSIQLSYAPDLPCIRADRNSIEKLILDLAISARERMREGGQLALSTALANIEMPYLASHPDARLGRFVCLSMIDTGCGLEREIVASLANPSRADKAGLSAVAGIVKHLQGWMEVQSEAGQGSTVKVFFPAGSEDEQTEKAPAPLLRGGAETILVVEDEPPVLWTTRNILEHYGYHVLEAASGVEALALWHQRHGEISLLLTDIVMPVGVSGPELAEQFLHQKPGLKLIYTSGYSSEAAANNLELVEGVNFLQKPYDAETLVRAVRRSLDA